MILTINSGQLSKAHSTDAGFDIHCSEDKLILPMSSEKISTNLHIQLPIDTVALVKPRSGLSFKYDIETGAGVIDETYTGEIKVHLYNLGTEPYKVNNGDKIAQLLVLPILHPVVLPLHDSIYNEPSDLKRGTKGFGDSGK